VSELFEVALQVLLEGGAWIIEERYGAKGCFVTIGILALAALFIFWWASRL